MNREETGIHIAISSELIKEDVSQKSYNVSQAAELYTKFKNFYGLTGST